MNLLDMLVTPLYQRDLLREKPDDHLYWFRVESRAVNAKPVEVEIYMERFLVLKVTPCGAWVDNYGERKFVRKDAYKRFCCESRGHALVSFVARKRRQVKILSAQLKMAQAALDGALKLSDEVLKEAIGDAQVG